MTKSEQIRRLAAEGLSVAAIAQRLSIRYQHAYNVLNATKNGAPRAAKALKPAPVEKPLLTTDTLLAAGFTHAARWTVEGDGYLVLDSTLPNEIGVYAFARGGVVLYVGVASSGLKGRLYGYVRPGKGQPTNLRLNDTIKAELLTTPHIDVLIATPGAMEWNGLPVHAAAGLELGLIKKYALPWNVRSAK